MLEVSNAILHDSQSMGTMLHNKDNIFGIFVLTICCGYVFCDLVDDIFKNYSTVKVPVLNKDEVLTIDLRVELAKLYELNIRDQSVTAHVNLDMNWKDEYLNWNSDFYNGVDKIQVSTSKIWFPDLAVYNSVENAQDIGQDTHKVEVYSDGSVRYWGYKIFTYECKIDITWYPFDSQNCSINVGMWYNNISIVHINDDSNNSLSDSLRPNGEFHITNGGNFPYIDVYKGQNFSAMRYAVSFERKWFYEVSRALIPVVAISFLNCITFGLPAASGERITTCISIFLAYIFMLNIISDIQPRTSDGISLLGIYINIQLVSSIITVTFSIVSLSLYHNGTPSLPGILCLCQKYVVSNKNKQIANTANMAKAIEINDNVVTSACDSDSEKGVVSVRCSNKLDAILLRLSFVFQTLLLLGVILSVVIMKVSVD